MTQQEHLNRIRARCVELLEIAGKITVQHAPHAQAGWKAAIAAIDTVAGLQKVPYGWDGDCGASAYADNLADSIIASWPEELL